MNRRSGGRKTATKGARAEAGQAQSSIGQISETGRLSGVLEEMLSLIRAHPGIRPSELNRYLNREQSDGLRNTLVKRGLIRKEKDGSAVRYYPL
jgi:hypothetical protein